MTTTQPSISPRTSPQTTGLPARLNLRTSPRKSAQRYRKWRATQVRDRVARVARKLIELASLTPSLKAYDTLLESEVAYVG